MKRGWVRGASAACVLLTLGLLEPVERSVESGATEEDAARFTLRVRVVSLEAEEKRAPVPGAEIVFHGASGDQYVISARGRTDARGEFQEAQRSQGGWLVVRAPGFARRVIPWEARPEEEEAWVELELEPGRAFVVDVRVETEGGALVPLPQATVLIGEERTFPWGARTDAAGRATFPDVPGGPQRVQVYAPGYAPFIAESEGDLLVRLRPVEVLRVRVVHQGVVLPDAEVHISGLSLWPERILRTGVSGSVDITGLSPGRYSLYAEHGRRISSRLSEIEILAERGAREVELEITEGKFLKVSVVSDLRESLSSAQLTWSQDGLGQWARRAETDATGRVSLGPLPSVEGVILAAKTGHIERVVSVEKNEPLEIVLERSGVILGRVVDAEGFPIEQAEIEVVGTDSHQMPVFVRQETDRVRDAHFAWALGARQRWMPAGELGVTLGPVPPIPLAQTVGPGLPGLSFTSGAKGRFRIANVPPGQIVVLGRHPDYLDGKSAPVELRPGAQAEVEIVLGRGESLRGRVLDDRSFPVSDARVSVSARGFERLVTVEPDGSFELGAAPPSVTFRVTRRSRPLRVLLEERLEERRRGEEIVLMLPPSRESSLVRVVDASGERLTLAQVRLSSRDPKVPFEETRFTSDRGESEFVDSRGLSVELEIKAMGFVDQRRPLRLEAENRIVLERALEVEGRVTTARGRVSVEGAEISLESGAILRRAVTSATGEYKLVGVPPGRALLRASHPEQGRGELAVFVEPGLKGRPSELPSIDLEPTASLSGRVVDSRGFPVASAWVTTEPTSAYQPSGTRQFDGARTNEQGEFELESRMSEELQLFVMLPATGLGRVVVPLQKRDRAIDIELRLDELDLPPPEERGSVLASLVEKQGQLEIAAVARGSVAERAGLRRGDLLLRVEGDAPRSVEEARAWLSGLPGTEVRVEILRAGQPQALRLSRETFLR